MIGPSSIESHRTWVAQLKLITTGIKSFDVGFQWRGLQPVPIRRRGTRKSTTIGECSGEIFQTQRLSASNYEKCAFYLGNWVSGSFLFSGLNLGFVGWLELMVVDGKMGWIRLVDEG